MTDQAPSSGEKQSADVDKAPGKPPGEAKPQRSLLAPDSLLGRLAPVALGACLGVIPVVTSNTLSARYALDQQRANRQVTAMQEFSMACSRAHYALQSLAMAQFMTAAAAADVAAGVEVPAAVGEGMLKAQGDLFSALATLDAQEAVAAALFRMTLQSPYIAQGPTEAELKDPDAYLRRMLSEGGAFETDEKKFAEGLARSAGAMMKSQLQWREYCDSSVKRMADSVQP